MPSALIWEPHPDAWLLVIAVLGAYLYALSAWGPAHAPARGFRPATRSQRTCFFLGVAALWVGADWPVHTLAESYLYSVHMVQHFLFQLVAAPLLILGTPGWLLRRLLSPPRVQGVARQITRPLPALIIVSGFTAVTHVPAVVDASVANGAIHFALHVAIVLTGLVMWWPVLSPLPELPHLSYPGRMAYLFGHSILPTVPASFLTFTHDPLYAVYAAAPRLLPWLSPVQDQQIAGLFMKIAGGFLLWGVITVLFFRWQSEEESGGPDMLYWRDLEHDLEGARPPR